MTTATAKELAPMLSEKACRLARGLEERAEALARRAIELDPSDPNGHLGMAWVAVNRANPAEAIAAAERAIELAPNMEFAHAARGLALAQQKRWLEATRSIRRALRLNPRPSERLLMSVAFVNFGAGRREEAVEIFEEVRQASADNIIARLALAGHYEQQGQHERASAAVEEILTRR